MNKTEQDLIELGKKVAHSNLKERTSKLEDRVTANEKNFNMTSVKLDTTLSRISTDLQYIKEKLIGKALEK